MLLLIMTTGIIAFIVYRECAGRQVDSEINGEGNELNEGALSLSDPKMEIFWSRMCVSALSYLSPIYARDVLKYHYFLRNDLRFEHGAKLIGVFREKINKFSGCWLDYSIPGENFILLPKSVLCFVRFGRDFIACVMS